MCAILNDLNCGQRSKLNLNSFYPVHYFAKNIDRIEPIKVLLRTIPLNDQGSHAEHERNVNRRLHHLCLRTSLETYQKFPEILTFWSNFLEFQLRITRCIKGEVSKESQHKILYQIKLILTLENFYWNIMLCRLYNIILLISTTVTRQALKLIRSRSWVYIFPRNSRHNFVRWNRKWHYDPLLESHPRALKTPEQHYLVQIRGPCRPKTISTFNRIWPTSCDKIRSR